MATTISDICIRSRDILRLPSQPEQCRQQPAITSSSACRSRCLSQECTRIAQFTHYIFLSQQCTCLTTIEVLNASPASDIFCPSTCNGPPPCEPAVNGPFNIRPVQAEAGSSTLSSVPEPTTIGGPSTDIQQPGPTPTLSEPALQSPTSTSSPSTASSSGLLLSTTNIAIIAASIGFAAILLAIGGLLIFKHRKQSSQKPSPPPSAAPLPPPPPSSARQPSSRPSIPNRFESFAPIATEPFLLATTTPVSPLDSVGRSMTYSGDIKQQHQNDDGVLFASMPRRDGKSGQNGDLDRLSTVWEPVKPISSEEILGLRGIDRNSTNLNFPPSSTLYRNSHEDGEHEPLAS